jgi:hypothetical protein
MCFFSHSDLIHHQWEMLAALVSWKQATAKQWWALHQPPICEFKTWNMINIDQLHHSLTQSWYPYMGFSSHFGPIPHLWQVANHCGAT